MRIERRLENIEFREKAAGQRNTNERENKNSEQRSGRGLAPSEAGKIVNTHVPLMASGDVTDDGESANVHERIGRQIEHRSGNANVRSSGERDQYVAGVCDRA